jgi:hypothetical protein
MGVVFAKTRKGQDEIATKAGGCRHGCDGS